MIKVFVTFNGCTRGPTNGAYLGPPILEWGDAIDSEGIKLGGLVSNKSKLTEKKFFRKGNRYLIECNTIANGKIKRIKSLTGVKKKNTCNLFKACGNDFKIINGKYKNKMVSEMGNETIERYVSWIKVNSNNEDTLRNIRKINKLMELRS